jgi:hypothetical protein
MIEYLSTLNFNTICKQACSARLLSSKSKLRRFFVGEFFFCVQRYYDKERQRENQQLGCALEMSLYKVNFVATVVGAGFMYHAIALGLWAASGASVRLISLIAFKIALLPFCLY